LAGLLPTTLLTLKGFNMRQKANPTGADVAMFLGRQEDLSFVSQCNIVVEHIRAAAENYTRGVGFDDDNTVPSDIYAVLVSRSARTAVNPLAYQGDSADTTTVSDAFAGDWNRGERKILDAYRQKLI
jgi:hypothetical protein